MLLSLTLENYRSFADQAILDVQHRSFRSNLPKDGNWTAVTNRITGIYGPNASGKSTVIMALGALREAIQNSVSQPATAKSLRNPHALHKDADTFFEVEYVRNTARYRWSITLSDEGIREEQLDVVGGPNGSSHWRNLFIRTGQSIEFGRHFGVPKAARENISEFLRPWTLVFSAWSVIRDQGPQYAAVDWWTSTVRVAPTNSNAGAAWLHASMLRLMLHPTWKKAAHAVLQAADVGVTSVEIRKEKLAPNVIQFVEAFQEALASRRLDDEPETPMDPEILDLVRRSSEFTHSASGGSFTLPEAEESQGTRFWLDVALMSVHSLVTGEVLLIDELDASLHPTLVRFLIDLFLNPETNPSGAQLIYTSHDLTPLSNALGEHLSPSVIWLVEKEDARSSLVCLDEFRLGRNNNLERQYLGGAFGALPFVGTEVTAVVADLREEWLGFSDEENAE